jgi:hypothetical protein
MVVEQIPNAGISAFLPRTIVSRYRAFFEGKSALACTAGGRGLIY